MANNRRRSKVAERAIARKVKGRRVGILGKEDVSHEKFSIEVKLRKKFVAEKWMKQAIKNCQENKIPLVIVHISGQRYDNDYVILKLRDFLEVCNVVK